MSTLPTIPTDTFGFSSLFEQGLNMPCFHQHNEIEIGFVTTGTSVMDWGYGPVPMKPQRLMVMWAMVPHRALQTSPIGQAYVVNLPISWFLSWRLPSKFTLAVMQGRPQVEPHPDDHCLHDLRSFRKWHEEINSDDTERRKIALLDIEVRLRRLAWDIESVGTLDEVPAHVSGSEGSELEMNKVGQMAAYIAAHYRENIRMSDVAQAVGLHENYAMQLFRRSCGVTLLQHVTQHRIWHAQRLLMTTDLPMGEVAQAVGFGSDSQFYSIFKRTCGITPREFRSQLKASAVPSLH